MRTREYTVEEMKSLLEHMSGMYDLARVVDPTECRILEFDGDGRVRMNQSCYGIWNSNQKCLNCSSALACRTGCHQEKSEQFQDQLFHIQSNPVKLKLPDGGAYDAVMELVTIGGKEEDAAAANDRAAENVGDAAAQYQAHHDALTKVLNAGAFSEQTRREIERRPAQRWVMITANIRDFRLVNTLFGVYKGNDVLVRTAALLRQIAQKADGLCGRLGGDQFALLLPCSGFDEGALRGAALALTEAFSSGLFTFCIHFGVYRIEDSSIPVSVMCDRANSALRTIRDDLRETVAHFDDSMMRKSLFEHEIISGFEEALADGQFRLYLQPMVGADGHIYGAEALVRWCRPDGSVVMPGDFIETLEHAGLIPELDICIWEQAVRQLRDWQDSGMEGVTISVNMSAKDFYSLDVYRVLTELTERYGVNSRLLRLEITETALLEEPEKSNTVVSRLRERGFLVEIDDFGKGYSSLIMLKNIHADVLKLDMSLLHEIESNQRSRTIVESVVNMALTLGMDVVAEGVETQAQLELLVAMGCRFFQGYYFSRPVPVAEFEQKLAAQK